jgi:ABC-type multidrug transport system, ATPase component
MLKAENLVKSFYRTEAKGKRVEFNAVDGISISVEKGEILGILGPNGAGKTTLLRMLAGLMVPTSGDVYVLDAEGNAAKDSRIVKRRIGYLSGNTKLYGRMSVRELLKIFGTMYEIDDEELDKRIEKITEVLNMESFVDNRIERLSTGQTQRASIARTIIHDPDIYIFDEPTLGLDIISSSAIIEFMKKEKERGKTVIYSTHYMEEAEYLCDRIIMLNKGKTICNASPAELKKENGVTNMRDAFYRIIESEGIGYEV